VREKGIFSSYSSGFGYGYEAVRIRDKIDNIHALFLDVQTDVTVPFSEQSLIGGMGRALKSCERLSLKIV
jgi:hypothetical protein